MATEYRVVWTREGGIRKVKRYATRVAAERRMLLLGPEPWKAFGKDPDALWCCSGYECGCDGLTVRGQSDQSRLTMPALLSVHIEARAVGKWSKTTTTQEQGSTQETGATKHVGNHHFKFDGEKALREARDELLRCRAALGRETELRVEEQRLRVTSARQLTTVYVKAIEYLAVFDAKEDAACYDLAEHVLERGERMKWPHDVARTERLAQAIQDAISRFLAETEDEKEHVR